MAKKKHERVEDRAYVYAVKNNAFNDVFLAAWESILYPGTPVMYDTRFGLDLGFVLGSAPISLGGYWPGSDKVEGACLNFLSEDEIKNESESEDFATLHQCSSCPGCQIPKEPKKIEIRGNIDWIDHLATPAEMARYEENLIKEGEALKICSEKAEKRGLEMKVVAAHFLAGEMKVIFFFTSENRIDFRDLVKDLVAIFRMRIEMRQIGTREEVKTVGGLGVCGREACCHLMSAETENVAMKMAKEQNLSLNAQKITGLCGKLFCCLNYEYEYYLEEKARYPEDGERIKIDKELWRVKEANILSKKIALLAQDGRELSIPIDKLSKNPENGHWTVDEEFLETVFSS